MPGAPKALAFVCGVLDGAQETGRVSVWRDAGNELRLLVTASRDLVLRTSFLISVDGDAAHYFFKPARGLPDGDARDGVFASTQPLNVKTQMAVSIVLDGDERKFAAYDLRTQALVAHAVPFWTVEAVAEAGPAMRQREVSALLRNFRAIKNSWPKLRPPAVAMTKNTELPLPDVAFRQRVQGAGVAGDPEGVRFINVGFQHAALILRIAEVYGARFTKDFRTLDWGVGCGRIARHMPPPLQRGLSGIDVDPVNIEWCQQHMPFGEYRTVDPFSPTSYDDASFDLIYSHSVLTHLGEDDQFLWLEELARICRGFMILSVHGLFSAQTSKWAPDPNELWRYLLGGFRNSRKQNPDIKDVTPSGYYTDVAHTPAYIQANWTRHVEIVDIIPGGFGDLHDAVICRRPSD